MSTDVVFDQLLQNFLQNSLVCREEDIMSVEKFKLM